MINLSWNEAVDIRHALLFAKMSLYQHGHLKEACDVDVELKLFTELINKHDKDQDDKEKK
jgi:hypothetical protein